MKRREFTKAVVAIFALGPSAALARVSPMRLGRVTGAECHSYIDDEFGKESRYWNRRLTKDEIQTVYTKRPRDEYERLMVEARGSYRIT